jgi:hypothetical protein
MSQSKSEPFAQQCMRDGVKLIAVVGDGCEDLEEEIDWIAIGDGSIPNQLIPTTSSHPNEPVEEVLEFAALWLCDGEEGVHKFGSSDFGMSAMGRKRTRRDSRSSLGRAAGNALEAREEHWSASEIPSLKRFC